MRRPVDPASVLQKWPFGGAFSTGSRVKMTTSNIGNPLVWNSDSSESVSVAQSWCFGNSSIAASSTQESTSASSTGSAVQSLPMTHGWITVHPSGKGDRMMTPASTPVLRVMTFPMTRDSSIPKPGCSVVTLMPPFAIGVPTGFGVASFKSIRPFDFPVEQAPVVFNVFGSRSVPIVASATSTPPAPVTAVPGPPTLNMYRSIPAVVPPKGT